MNSRRFRLGATVRLAVLIFFAALARTSYAGAGISLLTIFDPVCMCTQSTVEACTSAPRIADAVHSKILEIMQEHDVWGIEMLTREAATSTALATLGTPAPQWTREYSTSWTALLNTNEMITYAVLGEVSPSPGNPADINVRFELWDFILNHRITTCEYEGVFDTQRIGAALAPPILASLQLYFAEIVDLAGQQVVINVGPETVSTGTQLNAFAHGHLGPHPRNYPAHGHKEEDDHLIGSQVYARYRGSKITTGTVHTHSRSPWRLLLQSYPPALQPATLSPTSSPALSMALQPTDSSISTAPAFNAPSPAGGLTPEEIRLLNLAHFYSGRPTGKVRVTGFLRPNKYYNQYFAVAEITTGTVIPGSFLRLSPDSK